MFNIRLEDDRQCLLVLMGATENGRKELVAVVNGVRESKLSWKAVLLELKQRGLATALKLAIGDGALDFWSALREVFPETRTQRCTVHKTANVLNQLPKKIQPQAKGMLHEIWNSPTKADADNAFDLFVKTYQPKYHKATDCLEKDREELLTYYDFPAENWCHIRTTNPIESTFSTIRLRHRKTRGCGSAMASSTMMFKLAQSTSKNWRRLRGHDHFPELMRGVKFIDGIPVRLSHFYAASSIRRVKWLMYFLTFGGMSGVDKFVFIMLCRVSERKPASMSANEG